MPSNKALLVIDMQKGSFTEKTPRYNTPGIITIMNTLTEAFRTNSYPVIFIQHDGSAMNEYIPDTEEWEILDDLNVCSGDILINKYANDVFYRSKLETVLENFNTTELFITGCATDFCIESTVQSALTKDYNITVVEDGHTTGERPKLKAIQVIDHYNWVWQNMIPTKGKIRVIPHEQVLDGMMIS